MLTILSSIMPPSSLTTLAQWSTRKEHYVLHDVCIDQMSLTTRYLRELTVGLVLVGVGEKDRFERTSGWHDVNR